MVEIMEKLQNQGGGQTIVNEEFNKFLNERKFKKKFVEYLIEHV